MLFWFIVLHLFSNNLGYIYIAYESNFVSMPWRLPWSMLPCRKKKTGVYEISYVVFSFSRPLVVTVSEYDIHKSKKCNLSTFTIQQIWVEVKEFYIVLTLIFIQKILSDLTTSEWESILMKGFTHIVETTQVSMHRRSRSSFNEESPWLLGPINGL